MDLIDIEGILILPGGSDICPSLYGKKNYKSYVSDYSILRDMEEAAMYQKALEKGQPVIGICRGMQLMSALNGLTLIQNIHHPGGHSITVEPLKENNVESVYVNSLHHQLVWTENKLETEKFKVYGHCSLSDVHDYQKDEKVECTIEPEIIYFPETRSLGVQFHPEMMYDGKRYADVLNYLVELAGETILKQR
jgi:putative glutamine amidotransferase